MLMISFPATVSATTEGVDTKFVSDLVGQFSQEPLHLMDADRSSGIIDAYLKHPAACICKCAEGLETFVLPGLLEFNVLALDHGGYG